MRVVRRRADTRPAAATARLRIPREEARHTYVCERDGDLPGAARRREGRDRRDPGAAEARERHGSALFVDVRERDEWDEGIVPGALHIPRGNLESRIEGLVPDRDREIVVYCSGGSRSAFAAKALHELGYANVTSLTGGFTDWKRNGFPVETPRGADPEQRPLQPPPAHPRGRRGGAGAAARRRVLLRSAPAGSARPPRSTSPRRASARSGSSTPTSSTTRTCSARSCTRPTGSASRRWTPRSGRSRRSTPTST